MIAEDYRQLFGSETARSGDQINNEIPRAPRRPRAGGLPRKHVHQVAGYPATTTTAAACLAATSPAAASATATATATADGTFPAADHRTDDVS